MGAFACLLRHTSVGRVLAELFGPGGLTPNWLRRSTSTTPSPGRQLAAEAINRAIPVAPSATTSTLSWWTSSGERLSTGCPVSQAELVNLLVAIAEDPGVRVLEMPDDRLRQGLSDGYEGVPGNVAAREGAESGDCRPMPDLDRAFAVSGWSAGAGCGMRYRVW